MAEPEPKRPRTEEKEEDSEYTSVLDVIKIKVAAARRLEPTTAPGCLRTANVMMRPSPCPQFVNSATFGDSPLAHTVPEYAPDYAHQIFPDERVKLGECPELRVECVYDDATLATYLRPVGMTKPIVGGPLEDAMHTLAAALPLAKAEAAFVQALSQSVPSPVELVGPKAGEYKQGVRTFDVYCGPLHATTEATAFMDQLQTVMRWYIEGWSDVDDDERWRLIAIFERPIAEG